MLPMALQRSAHGLVIHIGLPPSRWCDYTLVLIDTHDDMNETPAPSAPAGARMTASRRGSRRPLSLQVAERRCRPRAPSVLLVGVVRMRMIGCAGRHPDQQMLPPAAARSTCSRRPLMPGPISNQLGRCRHGWSGYRADRHLRARSGRGFFRTFPGGMRLGLRGRKAQKRVLPIGDLGLQTPRPNTSRCANAWRSSLPSRPRAYSAASLGPGFTGSGMTATFQRRDKSMS